MDLGVSGEKYGNSGNSSREQILRDGSIGFRAITPCEALHCTSTCTVSYVFTHAYRYWNKSWKKYGLGCLSNN